nr:hypothetical protein [Tanacetum cinerariifolium]
MVKDFDNVAFGQVVSMAVSEHFLHTKPNIGYRFVFMLRKGSDFSEESIKKSWRKNRLMKAVRSSSHVLIFSSFSSSNHVFASPKFVNVFMRIGFGSTIKLVSLDESQVVTFNDEFVCGFRNGDYETRSRSDNTVGNTHGSSSIGL